MRTLSRPDYTPVHRRDFRNWIITGVVVGLTLAGVSHLIPAPSSSKELPEPPAARPSFDAVMPNVGTTLTSSNFTVAGDAVIEGCLRIHVSPHDVVIGICKSGLP